MLMPHAAALAIGGHRVRTRWRARPCPSGGGGDDRPAPLGVGREPDRGCDGRPFAPVRGSAASMLQGAWTGSAASMLQGAWTDALPGRVARRSARERDLPVE